MGFFRTIENVCPVCKKILNAANLIDDDGFVSDKSVHPDENSVTFCTGCGEMLMFNSDLTLREITDADRDTFTEEEIVYFEECRNKVVEHLHLFKNGPIGNN